MSFNSGGLRQTFFHALAWQSKDAFTFLKEIPVYEKSGILCRIPNWWKGKASNLRVNIGIGNTSPSCLGMDSILDFDAKLYLGDTPVTEKREFAFINDLNLRDIVERDYSEIQKAYISHCWKSVIILSGGAIEAILTDLLLANETSAKSAKSASNKPDITRWDLSNLIDVSVELKLVSAGVEKLSHPIREYRNLVHPGNEVRNQLKFDAEEAKIALEVL